MAAPESIVLLAALCPRLQDQLRRLVPISNDLANVKCSTEVAFRFLACVHDETRFDSLFKLVEPGKLTQRIAVESLVVACGEKHPRIGRLFEVFHSICSPQQLGAVCKHFFDSDCRELHEIAVKHSRDTVKLVDSVTRGLLPLERLAAVKKKTGVASHDFWIASARREHVDAGPSDLSAQSAVRFGDESLMKVISEAIPKLIKPAVVFPYIFDNFQRASVLLRKLYDLFGGWIPEAKKLSQGLAIDSPGFIRPLWQFM
jgi:hypothetical protein